MAYIKDKQERDFRLVDDNRDKVNFKNLGETRFNKMRVGNRTVPADALLSLDYFETKSTRKQEKERVEKAIEQKNISALRQISDYYYNKSGIYERLCKYIAYLYRYDRFVTPIIYDKKLIDTKKDKIIEGWYKSCKFLENCNLKKNFGKIALKVVRDGCYYGYKIADSEKILLQDLPIGYCRSRYTHNDKPVVEFNVKYFDDTFSDSDYRIRILKLFPKEIQKGYIDYKNGKLPTDYRSDSKGWILLDVNNAVKFNIGDSDIPMFVSVVPKIIDLEDAQALDRDKMMQQLIKIIVQKFPLDKNYDLVFDVSEMNDFHNMAVGMLGNAIGVDVLSTLADVDTIDLSDSNLSSTYDQLEKVERTVYNEAGVSQLQFNTDGNIALEKSITNDESSVLDLIYQFEEYAQSLIAPLNKNNKIYYKVQILPTTGYNYKDLAKLYKEEATLGFSKLLPQVVLGQTQSEVIASAIFENKMMELNDLFVPPQSSNTTSGKSSDGDSSDVGRPSLPDDQKTEKTISNRESQ